MVSVFDVLHFFSMYRVLGLAFVCKETGPKQNFNRIQKYGLYKRRESLVSNWKKGRHNVGMSE